MFLELFWPKEIKELVAKYRAEDTLNEESVEYLNMVIRRNLILWIIIFFVFILLSLPFLAIALLLLSPLSTWFDVRNSFRRQMTSYAYGEKIEVLVTYAGSSLYGTQMIWCRTLDSNKKIRIVIATKPKISLQDFPKEGQKIFVYQDKEYRYKAMPDIDYLKRKYSLTTTTF